jgi:hypothetical protein
MSDLLASVVHLERSLMRDKKLRERIVAVLRSAEAANLTIVELADLFDDATSATIPSPQIPCPPTPPPPTLSR